MEGKPNFTFCTKAHKGVLLSKGESGDLKGKNYSGMDFFSTGFAQGFAAEGILTARQTRQVDLGSQQHAPSQEARWRSALRTMGYRQHTLYC